MVSGKPITLSMSMQSFNRRTTPRHAFVVQEQFWEALSKPWGRRGEGAATHTSIPRMIKELVISLVYTVMYLYATVHNKVPGSIHRKVPKHTMRLMYAQHQRSVMR